MKEQELAKSNLILKVQTGSYLYGTETPDSDFDFQGVFVPPKEYVTGIHKCEQVIVNDDKSDYTCFTLPKYIQLAMANNPNILSVLYTPCKHIVYSDKYGKALIEARSLFLSKKAYHTFRGYAHAQRKKILSKNPIGTRKEIVEEFGYDTKFAMHLIRLLYEGLDILVSKEIIYPSPQRILLKQIRNGEWSLERVLAEAIRLEALIDDAYVRSDLQYKSNEPEIEKLQMKMLDDFWNEQKLKNIVDHGVYT